MKKLLFTLSAINLALFSNYSLAEQQPVDNSPVIEVEKVVEETDSVTGVQYELDENGEFARIRSTGEAELEFGDRKEIRIAVQKAQMRAKANIAKFLSERVKSDEVIDNMEEVVTSTSSTTDANGGKVSKQATRETLEKYSERISISAEQILKGVIVTKEDINKDQKYVRIEVGVSPKTQNAADIISQGNRTDSTQGSQLKGSSGSLDPANSTGREIRKSKNYDNF